MKFLLQCATEYCQFSPMAPKDFSNTLIKITVNYVHSCVKKLYMGARGGNSFLVVDDNSACTYNLPSTTGL